MQCGNFNLGAAQQWRQGRRRCQVESVVKLALRQQPSIRCDGGAVTLQLYTGVEIEPQTAATSRFTHRAYHKSWIDVLVEANSGLKADDQIVNLQEVEELISDKIWQTVALVWFYPKRMENDYNLVKTYIGVDEPFDMTKYYTNAFLDKAIKMVPAKSMD